ncbi:HK97 family phage major capsid protein [Enterococcus sp. AZ150]|uniref:phage major capsid protein n=1 Tax=Enterococcus sp. AZ150 TaxID=2774866 RepID=UPI003F1E4CB4
MFEEKMKEIRSKIAETEAKLTTQATEIRSLLESEKLDEAKAVKEKREALKSELKELRENLALYEEHKEGNTVPVQERKATPQQTEYRDALNDFIRSKGEKREGVNFKDGEAVVPASLLTRALDGIKSETVDSTIPESVVYNPQMEIKTVTDLKQFTNIFQATTASGKYPILKKATARLNSVAELEANPALAKPEFDEVDWAVKTYRGAIPISNESIQDSAVDLVGVIARHANEQKLNTTNFAIAEVFKTFAAKTASTLDDIKKIINVDLDAAYSKALVASQSFYNVLDTLKDGNGRYLLQDSVVSPTGKVLLGMPVFVIEDDLLGATGEAKAFIGDLDRAVLFANRVDVTVRWIEDKIYGQYLQVATRFDVKAADKNAGYFVTFTPAAGE